MRATSLASLVLAATVVTTPALGAPAAVQPFDEPQAAPVGEIAPIPPPSPPDAPPAAPQATDDEAPHRPPPAALIAAPPPPDPRPFDPDPSEPGRILVESLLGFFTADFAFVGGAVAGGWPILLAPLVTGGIVCAIGSGSDDFDGSCGAAIGGAYLGSLLAVPMGFLFAAQGNNESELPAAVVGIVLGLVVGSTAGAVIGWNVSREPKARDRADVARLDALASARALPWTDPLRARVAPVAGVEGRLSVPLVAFRF